MLFARAQSISEVRALTQELNNVLLGPLLKKYSVHPPAIVHYTSVEALSSILSSGNFRMSHFRHLNDSTEMLHGRAVVNDLMRAEVERGDCTSPFFNYCRFSFNEQDNDAIQYFVSSFSVSHDSTELWRRYGAQGSGVAIVFDTKRMGADPNEPFAYHIGRVTYTARAQSLLLSPLVEATKFILSRYIRRYGYDVRDIAVQRLAAKFCSHLNHHSISLKNKEWSVEREWRTVFSVLRNDGEERKARVRSRADGHPYVDVAVRSCEPEDVRMPIVTVTAGTHADRAAIRATLDRFCYQHVTIKQSSITAGALARASRNGPS